MPQNCFIFLFLLFRFTVLGQSTEQIEHDTATTEVGFLRSIVLDSSKLFVVDTNELIIHNSHGLDAFFSKITALIDGNRQKVRVTQIGDSHIQAGFVTRRIRDHMQRDLGNGGRGLIFPYKQARTNGPSDYKIKSNIDWAAKRNVHPNEPMDIGVAGITVGANDSLYYLQVQMKERDQFDTMVIFHKGPIINPYTCYTTTANDWLEEFLTIQSTHNHKIKSGETLSGISVKYDVSIADIKRWNTIKNDRIYAGQTLIILQKKEVAVEPDEKLLQPITGNSAYTPSKFSIGFPSPTNSTLLRYQGATGHEINGIYVENADPGLVYSMIGVNGAKYEHYNKSVHFQEQLRALNNDLLIIALGTNESLDPTYDSLRLEEQVAQFIDTVQHLDSSVSILFFLNPDAYQNKRKNPNAKRIHNILQSICNRRHLAYFDPYALMGGSGGIYSWYKADLASRDLVHFTVNGYYYLGDLFYYSLMKSYASYRTDMATD